MAIISTVKNENFEIEYCKFGYGNKKMVIIPGISIKSVLASSDFIESEFSLFKNDFTVYLFDRKKDINDEYSIKQMADDTANAMKSLNIDNAYIFGTSQGGMIAQIIAIKYPDLVSKLVLASTVAKSNPVFDDTINNWMKLSREGKVKELNEYFIDNVFSKSTLDKFRDYLLSLTKYISNDELQRFYYLAKANLDFDIYDDLDKIKCPVYAIGGLEDKILSVKGTIEIAERLKCKYYIYDGYGHAVYDEAPDYRKRLYDFFNE